MNKWARMAAVAATVGGSMAGGTFGLASAASAAQSTQPISCDSLGPITIRTNGNHSSDQGGWSAAQIVAGGSGHLIPTSFSFGAHDDTANLELFYSTVAKGDGNANHHQQTITCTQTQTATVADLIAENGPPPGPLPDGVGLGDEVTVSFIVTAVPRP